MGSPALKDPIVYRDGVELPAATWRADQRYRDIVARGKRAARTMRIVASGAMIAGSTGSAFSPVLHTYTSGSSATETCPSGAFQCVAEAWASGGSGGGGFTTVHIGGGGGSGSYGRSLFTGVAGKTMTYTVGAAVTGGAVSTNGSNGNATTISSGTLSITTIATNGGALGVAGNGSANGSAGAGGTAGTGGTQANTAGNAGSNSTPGSGVTGVNAGPAGAGGTGGAVNTAGGNSGAGLASFYYT